MLLNQSEPFRRVLQRLLRDVEVALGQSGLEQASSFIGQEQALGNVREECLEELVGSLQTYIHDMFIDTTWPACPKHSNHPLWFGRDDSWWCDRDDERVAPLGELAVRGKH